jgi:hypothetical protein
MEKLTGLRGFQIATEGSTADTSEAYVAFVTKYPGGDEIDDISAVGESRLMTEFLRTVNPENKYSHPRNVVLRSAGGNYPISKTSLHKRRNGK